LNWINLVGPFIEKVLIMFENNLIGGSYRASKFALLLSFNLEFDVGAH
jgi:hypothetical protein